MSEPRQLHGYFTGQLFDNGLCRVYEMTEGKPDEAWEKKEEEFNDPIHVIEYSAFAELQEKLKVAEETLSWMADRAVESHTALSFRNRAAIALAKIRGE